MKNFRFKPSLFPFFLGAGEGVDDNSYVENILTPPRRFGGFFSEDVIDDGDGDDRKREGNLSVHDDRIQIDHNSSRISSALYAKYKESILRNTSTVKTIGSRDAYTAANHTMPAFVADAENIRSMGRVSSNERVINAQSIRRGERLQDNSASLLSVFFGAGEGEDGGSQGKHADDQRRQKESLGKGIHTQSPFFANDTLINQQNPVTMLPTTITGQFVLSTPLKNGDKTTTARNTLPALSRILDNRSNWLGVRTGSSGAMNIIPEAFITDNAITFPYISSIKHIFFHARLAFAVVMLFLLMASSVFAQSDIFEKLETLAAGREVPSWVLAQGIPVPNTDLRSPGTFMYSFLSDDPVSPHIVRMKDGIITTIVLTIPASTRSHFQEVFFNSRYDRVLVRQDTKETAYFLPSLDATIILDAVTGDVIRMEKTVEGAYAVSAISETPGITKKIAYAIMGLSIAAIIVTLVSLAIETARWHPKPESQEPQVDPEVMLT